MTHDQLLKLSDPELISLARQKPFMKNRVFEILVVRYQKLIYKVCSRFFSSSSTAEDMAQESFIKSYNYLDSLKNTTQFKSWLIQITMNVCRDKYKKNKRQQEIREQVAHELNLDSTEEKTGQNLIQKNLVESLMSSLSEIEQQIILLYYFSEYTVKEISDELQLGESAVKMRLKRARDKLLVTTESLF